MKKRITLGALTRVEYTAVIEVPDDATEVEVRALADKLYDEIDGGEYVDDEHFWEQGETIINDLDDDPPPDFEASRDGDNPHGWDLTDVK